MSTLDIGTLDITRLTPEMAEDFRALTFPAYRHLLALEPTTRHLNPAEKRLILPIGMAAHVDGRPAGLALAEIPGDDKAPQVLSLFVAPAYRNRGVGTRLLDALEARIAQRFSRLETVYMTGKPGIDAFERVLAKRGWEAPVARTITLRFTLEETARTPWFGRINLPMPPYEIFPWTDLTPEERDTLQRSNEASPWIIPGLEPWRHDRHGFEPVSSLGLRYHGEVVGWVINHRVDADHVRFTCNFMREDLSRRGRSMALYTASLMRLRTTSCRFCTLTTPMARGPMVEFLRRRCVPWFSFLEETRGAKTTLVRHAGQRPTGIGSTQGGDVETARATGAGR